MKRFSAAVVVCVLLSVSAFAQLPRSTPESQGVSSKAILDFLQAAGRSANEFHSFMLLRHGHVVAEGWWKPYADSLLHPLYSVSKSFTSTAIGLAVAEGRLHVTDKVVSFFPNDLPADVPEDLSALTVKDLLTMQVGQDPDPTGPVTSGDTNWVKAFFRLPLVNKPGTTFLYNSLGVYILSAIVQKVTGEKMIDYLRPRLFEPLGITGENWATSPQHINTGGWGLSLKTEDMARFGQLYLQGGQWNGRQIVPRAWVTEATTSYNDRGPSWSWPTPRDSSDWQQGYGYLFWRCRHGAFRADGAMGQYIIVMPAQDAVVAITCQTKDMQDEINLVWRYLLPAFHDGPLPADDAAVKALHQVEASL
ncbi:serine hydrolase domain-containing protein [Dinghuibacter silviterrae]|uniref:CubicO group peptidase (Beta-lactamase class C family) n=1 Tax=Dinghuibacter silviterrae TaxID=1539049 RepID=A0A4R8DER9_9BACT|nr:serine hydrolase [Dinghuibacter silviterrae]TDW95935.1 CubicO group peptidase (beta-lactamase class C family) [Dinghuibacter silviterrae]